MDWQQLYLDGETPWDKGEAAPPLVDWLRDNPRVMSGRILVPGCGKGHDVRLIASTSPDLRVVGLDISEKAIQAATRESVGASEVYEVGDLFQLAPRHRGLYDWIWEHTCFCAIQPEMRDNYVSCVGTALKPGGQLLGVFYLDPYDEEHQPGGGPPHGATREEIVRRFEGSGWFRLEEDFSPARTFPGREGRERVMRFRREDSRRCLAAD